MITYTTGDILQADVDAVINTVNTVGVMGKGLALQFKRRYPTNYKEYKRACDAGEVRIGSMFVTETHELRGPRFVINFPTKKHWRADSRMEYIRAGIQDLVRVIEDLGLKSVAVPPLGAGNGGLDWNNVRPVIHEALADLDGVSIQVYEPVNAHFTIAPSKAPRMTNSRALLVALMLAYSKRRQAIEPWEDVLGASHLEIQKLMYFASRMVPKMQLRFVRGQYGPYSDVVRIMLQEMEGCYLHGFGDGNDKVLALAPIKVTPEGIEALNNFVPEGEPGEFDRAVQNVLRTIQGFEGAYPIELLASVDWACREIGSDNHGAVVEYVRSWTPRKGRLFSEPDIAMGLEKLTA